MTEIVTSILSSSTDQMLQSMRDSTEGADLIELRVDGIDPAVSSKELELLAGARTKPLILTCRSYMEGGLFGGSEEERLEILHAAMGLSFDYVDVELSSLEAGFQATRSDSKLIASYHEFERFPESLTSIVARGIQTGAEIIKLAVKVDSLADAFALTEAGEVARKKGIGFVPIAMGPSGVSARILASHLGAEFAYASISGGPATGPGQIELKQLLTQYRFKTLGPKSVVLGILGCPVTVSLSPAMHNAWMAKKGFDGIYVPFEEADVLRFVEGARKLRLCGLSVTRPHKESILPFLHEVDPEARQIGAVNTVAVRDGKWKGFNTDVQGVVGPITKRTPIDGQHAVVMGTGGGARAAVYGLTRRGAKVTVLGRGRDKTQKLAEELNASGGSLDEFDHLDWEILVNATPVGGGEWAGQSPVTIRDVKPDAVVLDMVYEPEWTPLLLAAQSQGARVISGLEMLIVQAALQAEIWTGEKPTYDVLEKAAREEIERRKIK
jgi:3-dehydroquinate dehydratase/shikimate dehydrogenase